MVLPVGPLARQARRDFRVYGDSVVTFEAWRQAQGFDVALVYQHFGSVVSAGGSTDVEAALR
eukprot:7763018-Lingulodinium_polyedra.AAC.1